MSASLDRNLFPTYYLADIADEDIADGDLLNFTSSEDGEFVLAFDPALQTAKLSLLRIIIEGSYEDDDYDGDENGQTLDPFVRFVFLMANSIICGKKHQRKSSELVRNLCLSGRALFSGTNKRRD